MLDFVFEVLTPIGINERNFQVMLIGAILAMSIYITLYGGMFSLANAGFMGIGAYTSVILTVRYDWEFLPALIAGVILSGLIGILIGLPVLRLNDIYLAIATIGFGEIVVVLINNFDNIYIEITGAELPEEGFVGGALGVKGIEVITTTEHLLIVVVLLAYFFYRMHRSRFGRALVAIRQDPNVAANLGINVVYYKNMAFVIGAMIAGLAGGLSGHLNSIIEPGDYDFDRAVEILSYTVLGGTTSLAGPIVGGMAIEYIPEFLRRADIDTTLTTIINSLSPDLENNEVLQIVRTMRSSLIAMINGVVLVFMIEFLPGGIANPEMWRNIIRRIRKWLAMIGIGKAPTEDNPTPVMEEAEND